MEIDALINAYLGCRSNKRRSPDSVMFELHWERDLVRLLKDVNNRSLVPFLYGFVAPRPAPREVIACLMPGKVLQFYFDQYIRPETERRLTSRTYNNRIGYGPNKALEQLIRDIREVSDNYTRDCYVITRDITAYFPSSDLSRTYQHYRELIEETFEPGDVRDDLLYLLQRITYSYPDKNVRLRSCRAKWDPIVAAGKSVIFNNRPGYGACLGNQFWQVEKNYDLNDFDHFQVDTCGLHYIRFVDDMIWVVQNKEAGLAHVALSERMLLEEYGYKMHPRKRYCQHYTKGGKFIGVWFKFDRTYIGNRVVRHAEEAIRTWNRKACRGNLEHFLASINSYLGLMKHHSAYGIIRRLVDLVSDRWLRFCEYNDERRCFVALPGFTHNELLMRKYHFTLNKNKHKHEESRKNQRLAVATA